MVPNVQFSRDRVSRPALLGSFVQGSLPRRAIGRGTRYASHDDARGVVINPRGLFVCLFVCLEVCLGHRRIDTREPCVEKEGNVVVTYRVRATSESE